MYKFFFTLSGRTTKNEIYFGAPLNCRFWFCFLFLLFYRDIFYILSFWPISESKDPRCRGFSKPCLTNKLHYSESKVKRLISFTYFRPLKKPLFYVCLPSTSSFMWKIFFLLHCLVPFTICILVICIFGGIVKEKFVWKESETDIPCLLFFLAE